MGNHQTQPSYVHPSSSVTLVSYSRPVPRQSLSLLHYLPQAKVMILH